jgi:beta-N-acetylhexosaminidase
MKSPSSVNTTNFKLTAFERTIARRLILSFRFFDESPGLDHSLTTKTSNHSKSEISATKSLTEKNPPSDTNTNPVVTYLPDALADLITETDLGGVVLFAENIVSRKQLTQLTQQMQEAAKRSASKQPLFIGIDQEGGRVVRLNRDEHPGFSGNMAVGATKEQHGTFFAQAVGEAIASQLSSMGINLNFAPVVDVNSNPLNPVINTRSFGQNAKDVAELSSAMVDGLQNRNVMATLKHFPGHGNTAIDSHTGLPRVEGDLQQLEQNDLFPFYQVIKQANPAMIMTAHIQFPEVDNSCLMTKSGKKLVKPATLSRVLLTELLRNKMGYKGVVITDAMNMASIAEHFDPVESTAQAFAAGADIVLMPFSVRCYEDICYFYQFVRDTAARLNSIDSKAHEDNSAISRIDSLLAAYVTPHNQVVTKNAINQEAHSRELEKRLAFESLSHFKNSNRSLPLTNVANLNIQWVVSDSREALLIRDSIDHYFQGENKLAFTSHFLSIDEISHLQGLELLPATNQLVIFYSDEKHSPVVEGEFTMSNREKFDQSIGKPTLEDKPEKAVKQMNQRLENDAESRKLAKTEQLRELCWRAQSKKVNVILVNMQSPFEVEALIPYCDDVLFAYDKAMTTVPSTGRLTSFTYQAVISGLFGGHKITGIAPVALTSHKA